MVCPATHGLMAKSAVSPVCAERCTRRAQLSPTQTGGHELLQHQALRAPTHPHPTPFQPPVVIHTALNTHCRRELARS